MKISREVNLAINFVLNEILPPFLRDSILLKPAFKIFFGKKYPLFWNFRRDVYKMSEAEFAKLNADICDVIVERETDLNQKCVTKILNEVSGKNVLEVGCGGGFLAKKLAQNNDVTAVDIYLSDELKKAENANLRFAQSSAEKLPFADKSFDVVVCTHTLEHVRDIQKTLSELRRVAKSQLIIVVPKERPYFHCPNLHIHFFPYEFSLLAVTGILPNQKVENVGGDWYYSEIIK